MNSILLNRCSPASTQFDDFFRQLSRGEFLQTFSIATDVSETETDYKLKMDLAGFEKENISIDFKEGVLSISAKRECAKDDKETIHLSERRYGEFRRAFALKDVSDEEIKAEYQNGVLSVVIPKKPQSVAKKIVVS